MSTRIIMPQMGESIVEGTITKWLKKVGDKVGRDEPLFEISTDKVDSEIPSPATGVLAEILVPEGSTVQINTVVGVIGEAAGEAAEPAPVPEASPEAAAAPAREKPEAPGEPEAPQVTEPVVSAPPAVETAPPLAPKEAPRPAPAPPPAAAPAAPKPGPKVQPRDIRTSPLVRRLAREHNIDLSQVVGTGLEGRITRQDIERLIEDRAKAPVAEPAPAPEAMPVSRAVAAPPEVVAGAHAEAVAEAPPVAAAGPAPVEMPPFHGESETVAMTPMRKTISERMVASRRISAHVSTVFEVDMTSIVQLREKHKAEFERREGVKLTYTPFFVKALVDTVREFPIFNCSVAGDNIVYKKPVNVGVAVALEAGLIVPVIKDAHLKSFTGIVLAVSDLAERARTKRLHPDDVQDGTISITNPGIYGGLFGTPIISQPQVAILSIGGIEKRPVVINDAIAIRPMIYISLSFDHRVIDGAVADQFMARLKERLQSWTTWIE